MPNSNVLVGMKCPECGSEAPFKIVGSAWFEVYDNGTSDFDAVEWEDSSTCQCVMCGMLGHVADFKLT